MARNKIGEAAKTRQILMTVADLFRSLHRRTGCATLSLDFEEHETKITQTFPNGSAPVVVRIADSGRDGLGADPDGVDPQQLPFPLAPSGGSPIDLPGTKVDSAKDAGGAVGGGSPPASDPTGSTVSEAAETLSGVPSGWVDSKKVLLLRLPDNQTAEVRCADLPQLSSILGPIRNLRAKRITNGARRKLTYVASEDDVNSSLAASRLSKS